MAKTQEGRALNLKSVKEALKIIPVNREAFYRKLKNGELPCLKFGKKILVDIDEVLAVMRARKEN